MAGDRERAMRQRMKSALRAVYRRVTPYGGLSAFLPGPVAKPPATPGRDAGSPVPYTGPLRIHPDAWARAEAEAPDTPPHYGAMLDQLVRAAALNPRPRGMGREYDRIKPHFDAAFYFAHNRDIATKRIDPVAHYIRAGARERRDPTGRFSNQAYLRRYPDVGRYWGTPFDHWIRYGRAQGRDANPASTAGMDEVLGLSPERLMAHLSGRQDDLRDRLVSGELGRMVGLAARHDPAVMQVWPAALRLRVLPFSSTRITDRIASLYRMQKALDWRRARLVIVTGEDDGIGPVLERILGAAVASLDAAEIVVLQTQTRPPAPPPDPPSGLRILHMSGQTGRHPDDNVRLLADLLRSLRPAAVIADRGPLFATAMRHYGHALRACFNVVTTMPRDLPTPLGHPVPRKESMLYRALPMADLLVCEDAETRDALARAHHLDDADRGRLVSIADLAAPGRLSAALAPRGGDRE